MPYWWPDAQQLKQHQERIKCFPKGLQPQEATRRGTRGNVCCKDLTTKVICPIMKRTIKKIDLTM